MRPARAANRLAPLAHLGRHGRAFALAKHVQRRGSLGDALQDRLGHFFAALLLLGGRDQHSGNRQGGVQIRLALDPVERGGLVEGPHISIHQRPVPWHGASRTGARKGEMNLQVAPRHGVLQQRANAALQGVQLGRQMEVQIQAAMIDALQSQQDLAFGDGLADLRETGHTTHAHKSTTWPTGEPASSNCSSCSR